MTRATSVEQVVVALPALGTSTNLNVLLFFPPEVPAGVELKYELRWKWPGVWRGLLKTGGSETWSVTARTTNPIPRVRVEFRVPPAMPVTLTNRGANLDGGPQQPDEPRDDDGNLVYVWDAYKVPHDRVLTIELTRH